MIVAIDGPAGAGKSTVARAVAEALGFTYLDSGAMYRTVALGALERGRPPAEVARDAEIELGDGVRLDGRDVTAAIRAPEVSEAASRVAADPDVRAALVERQRAPDGDRRLGRRGARHRHRRGAGRRGQGVPHREPRGARAAAGGRAGRRHATRCSPTRRLRDERDRTRAHSPLRPAAGAVELDTTGLSVDQVVARIAALVAAARAA